MYLLGEHCFPPPMYEFAYPHPTARLAVRSFTAAEAFRQSESSCEVEPRIMRPG